MQSPEAAAIPSIAQFEQTTKGFQDVACFLSCLRLRPLMERKLPERRHGTSSREWPIGVCLICDTKPWHVSPMLLPLPTEARLRPFPIGPISIAQAQEASAETLLLLQSIE